ncbi:MAG: DUF4229 domain-containing protein [Nocardioidaceae bacterium]|nr:DUF4229 domain-containing protein [Nocardioidaceae bacterium]
MKPFLVYTGLRIGLFVLVWVVLTGIAALFGAGEEAVIWLLVVAAVLSSVLSLRLLAGPREEFAKSVQARAERASARFEEMKAKEDASEDAD